MDKTKLVIAAVVILSTIITLIIFVQSTKEEPGIAEKDEEQLLPLNNTGEVLELTSETFDKTIRSNDYVLVDFCK